MTITEQTRRDAHEEIKPVKTDRKMQILIALGDEALTAREIMDALGFTDMNQVRPRLHRTDDRRPHRGVREASGLHDRQDCSGLQKKIKMSQTTKRPAQTTYRYYKPGRSVSSITNFRR